MSHSKTKTVKKIHHPRLSSPKKKSLSPSKLIAKLFKGKTKKKLPAWYKETLPKVIRAKTKKRSNTKSLTPKNPFDKPLKTYNTANEICKMSLIPVTAENMRAYDPPRSSIVTVGTASMTSSNNL